MSIFSGGVGAGLAIVAGVVVGVAVGVATRNPALGFQVGFAVAGIGAALSSSYSTASQPEQSFAAQRNLGAIGDPEAPLRLIYGEVPVGYYIAWQGIGGNDNRWEGIDAAICRHPIEALVAVQLDDDYHPIVGTDTGSNIGLVLNSARSGGADSRYPTDWYVPTIASRWNRNPQQDSDPSQQRAHFAMKWYNADHPGSTNADMTTMFGASYSDHDGSPILRRFTGWTMAHMSILANTELGTVSRTPEILFHVKGKNNIYDPRLGSPPGDYAYTKNGWLVLADYLAETLGFDPGTDFVDLDTRADEADLIGWNGGSETAAFGVINGIIRDDEDPHAVALSIAADHMGGTICERGDQIHFQTGYIGQSSTDGSQTKTVELALDMSDAAGDAILSPPEEAEWVNTIVPHWVPSTVTNLDGNTVLHGKMEPAKKVTDATYVSDDGGDILRAEIKLPYCTLGRRARFLARSGLNQIRLGSTYQQSFKRLSLAMLLEPGDVVTVDNADQAVGAVSFQVANVNRNILDFTTGLGLRRYEDAIYTGATVTEDALGITTNYLDRIIPLITGLAAVVDDDSAEARADGRLKANVVVSWTAVANILVTSGGAVEIRWKRTGAPSWRGDKRVAGIVNETTLNGLNDGVNYTIGARAIGANGAVSDSWVTVALTVQAVYSELGSGLSDVNRGEVLGPNWNFRQGIVDATDVTPANATIYGWTKPGSGDAGSVNLREFVTASTGSQRALVVTADAQATSRFSRWWNDTDDAADGNVTSVDERQDAIRGAFLEVAVRCMIVDATGVPAGQRCGARLLYYDSAGALIDRESSGGPIRFDEYFIGDASETGGGGDVIFAAINTWVEITNTIQVPKGGYGIGKIAVEVQAENATIGSPVVAASIAFDYVRARYIDTFYGKQNRNGSVTGGDQTKSGREDLYRTLVGMDGRGLYNPRTGHKFKIVCSFEVQTEPASNPVVGYIALLRHLETDASADPQTAIGDGYTAWIEIDTDNDGTPDEYEIDVDYELVSTDSPVPTYPIAGKWTQKSFTWYDKAPSLPDMVTSPPTAPVQVDRYIYKLMCITDRASGEFHYRNASLTIQQVLIGTGDTTG